ncbi:MAG TPA: histidine kinase N-terminal 7TM domain-containing protein [Methanomassiliicoccales archaeon]
MALGFIFTLPLIATVMIAFFLAYSASKSALPIKWPFILSMAGLILATTAFTLEMSSQKIEEMIFWNNVEYLYVVFAAPLYLVLIIDYVGMEKWLDLRKAILLSLIPVATLIFLWTNDLHHLIYTSISSVKWGEASVMSVSYGPWFWIHIVYVVILVIAAIALCLKSLGTTCRTQRYQILGVVLSGLIPTAAIMVGLTESIHMPTSYILIIGFMLTSIIVFICSFRLEMFDINPLAFDTIISNIQDCTVVLDIKGRIIFLNPQAQKMIVSDPKESLGKPISEALPFLSDLLVTLEDGKPEELVHRIGTERQNYDVRASTIRNSSGTVIGRMLVLRDVTEERKTSDALRTANSKLMLLSSITRHDILNQLSVIRGYGDLIGMGDVRQTDVSRFVHTMVASAASIEKQVLFTREYQDLGVKEPEWQNLELVLARAKSLGPTAPSQVNVQVGKVEIFADRMLEKVFHNLIHNSAKHGQKVQRISIWSEPCGSDLHIIYEDDGVGISIDRKASIFQDGRVDSGIGLLMSRQILAITDISIEEQGQTGNGARFLLTVPDGGWRVR